MEAQKEKEKPVSLAPLDFEESLADLLQVKPIDNTKLKKVAPKKKSKPKTKQ